METTILKNVLILLFICFMQLSAERKDLSAKMFTFPVESDTAHVILVPNQSKSLTAVTLCLRFFSDLTRAQSLLSFATLESPNSFLLFKQANHVYEINEYDNVLLFRGLEDIPNKWNSVCATWNSQTGIAQLWVNGKPSTRKGVRRGSNISGTPSIILGQEQDSYGGKFDKAQSFVGMLTDVHMWDTVLPYPEIALYMNGIPQKISGNVINWSSLDFTIKEYVLVEDIVSGLND
ncbi:serum amyloid P-component-like [Alosa alosa]|uniref:serum amyloid P-component-like n=1 Tax=Alosa alosa TaxID=278164 RepID=UPI0020154C68|nr:serum amyloid P-component-like [Alosa alosa]